MACCIPRWYTRPKTVTHPSTNGARRALTSFMRRTPLTTTLRYAANVISYERTVFWLRYRTPVNNETCNLQQLIDSRELVHQRTQTRMLMVNSTERRAQVGDQAADRQRRARRRRARRQRRPERVARRQGTDRPRPQRRRRLAAGRRGGAGRDHVRTRPSLAAAAAVRPARCRRRLGRGHGDGDAAAGQRDPRPARRHASPAGDGVERRREDGHAEPVSGTCGWARRLDTTTNQPAWRSTHHQSISQSINQWLASIHRVTWRTRILWSRYGRHVAGITWHNAWNYKAKINGVIHIKLNQLVYENVHTITSSQIYVNLSSIFKCLCYLALRLCIVSMHLIRCVLWHVVCLSFSFVF